MKGVRQPSSSGNSNENACASTMPLRHTAPKVKKDMRTPVGHMLYALLWLDLEDSDHLWGLILDVFLKP